MDDEEEQQSFLHIPKVICLIVALAEKRERVSDGRLKCRPIIGIRHTLYKLGWHCWQKNKQ